MYDVNENRNRNEQAAQAEYDRLVASIQNAEARLGIMPADYDGWFFADLRARLAHLEAILAANTRAAIAADSNVAYDVPTTQGDHKRRLADRLVRIFKSY